MLDNIKIGKKLVGGFLLGALISVIIGFVGYQGMGIMGEHIDEIVDVRLPGIVALARIETGQVELKTFERTLLLKGIDQESQQQQFQKIEETWKSIEAALKKYEPQEKAKEDAALWTEFTALWAYNPRANEKGNSQLRDYHSTGTEED
jgi:methyl-accepting chemotaxis protein